MKIARFIKLRTFSNGIADLALEQNHNPLKRKVPVETPTSELTSRWLLDFKVPLDMDKAAKEPFVQ